jgi:aldose sugar dehydrogenase
MIMRQTLFDGTWGRLRAMVLAHGGALYLTTSNGGATDRVIRLTPVP